MNEDGDVRGKVRFWIIVYVIMLIGEVNPFFLHPLMIKTMERGFFRNIHP